VSDLIFLFTSFATNATVNVLTGKSVPLGGIYTNLRRLLSWKNMVDKPHCAEYTQQAYARPVQDDNSHSVSAIIPPKVALSDDGVRVSLESGVIYPVCILITIVCITTAKFSFHIFIVVSIMYQIVVSTESSGTPYAALTVASYSLGNSAYPHHRPDRIGRQHR
jgi:hypothetical protein